MILWHNEQEFEQLCWKEGNHDHPAVSATLNTAVHGVFIEYGVWDSLVQVTHQVTCCFCCARCTELASFLPMETQSRGALLAHICITASSMHLTAFMWQKNKSVLGGFNSSASSIFFSPLYKWTGQWLQYFTWTLHPILQTLVCKQLLSQHAGEHWIGQNRSE